MRERGITNYEAQIGVLALAPQQKFDSIVTRQSCNYTKEALRATLVDATARYGYSISIERMSRDVDKRPSLLACGVALLLSTWKQNEQRSETVFELGRKLIKWNRHRNENVRTSLC